MAESPLARAAASHNAAGWIERWAMRTPDRLAWADDSTRSSFAEAHQRVGRMASWLHLQGIQPGDRVALWLTNRVATLEALFAIARLGAIALPLNARLRPAEIAFQLADSRTRLVLVEPQWRDHAREALAALKAERPQLVEVDAAFDQVVDAQAARIESHVVTPEDPMILMYTSGTTGKPKGALLPHRKALYNSLNAQLFFGITAEDAVLVVAPLFHSLGLQILTLPALYAGASVRLQEGFDAERVWRTLESDRITYFGGVPTMHQRLLDAWDAKGRSAKRPPSLRFAFTAGAAASREMIERFHALGLEMKQGYGQTETSVLTCLESDQALAKAGSVGRPVFHAEVRLIDSASIDAAPSAWRDVGVGEIGEIVVRGPITMTGYWERPEANAETLREGWLRTGDLATRDADFDVTLVGRAREMYISGGENVYPAEVEATLVEHPAIAEAAVVGIPDPEWGEVGRAHLVCTSGRSVDIAELKGWLESRLARFKQPTEFVLEREFPRTASGKVQKNRLLGRSSGGD